MHIFPQGKHGWGLGKPGTRVHAWPGLFTEWAAFNGFFGPLSANAGDRPASR
jgi:hypothetical protein